MIKILSIPIGMLILFLAYTVHSNDLQVVKMKEEHTHLFTIYSKTGCPYCEKAVAFLKAKKLKFEEINITTDPEQWSKLERETGAGTVPYIFIDGRYIGGCTDLLELNSIGKLDEMLK